MELDGQAFTSVHGSESASSVLPWNWVEASMECKFTSIPWKLVETSKEVDKTRKNVVRPGRAISKIPHAPTH